MADAVDGFLQLNGLNIHYLEWGRPPGEATPTMLLVHGGYLDAHQWDGLAERFADRFRVVAPDLRGHGESQWSPENAYTTYDHASDLSALADYLGLASVVLVESSMGGRLSLGLAALRPDLVSKLVVDDSAPAVGPEGLKVALGRDQNLPERAPSVEALLELWQRAEPGRDSRALRERLAQRYRIQPDGSVARKFTKAAISGNMAEDLWPLLPRIGCPVLWVLSGGHKAVDGAPELVQRLREVLPALKWAQVPGSSHPVSVTAPGAFADLLEGFLVN